MPLFLFVLLVLLQALGVAGSVLNKKQVLMGYLAYDSRNYYPLSQTPDYDVVAISFLAFSSATHLSSDAHLSDNNVAYAPFYAQDTTRESEDVFKASIKDRTSRGRLVQMSIFYYNPETEADRQRLIDVVDDVVAKYGITGIDIASTTNDISLDPGDTDYANPKTAAVINLISAVKSLKAKHGDSFVVTVSSALYTVQGGHTNYSSTSGTFIPIIDALRDEIDIVCPRNYAIGTPIPDLDGAGKDLASMESHVSMPDMLLNGFSVAGSNSKPFAPLRQDQVCISALATYDTGHYGYVAPTVMQSVVTCLTQGSGCGTYKPKGGPYPNVRGILTDSIDDDQHHGGNFFTSIKSFLETLDGNSDSVVAPPTPNTPVSGAVNHSTASSPFGSTASSSSATTTGTAGQSSPPASASSVGQSDPLSSQAGPLSSQSGSGNPSIDEAPEVTSTTTSKKSVQIVAAVVPVVVILFGIAFIPIHKCRKRRRARRRHSGGPSHSPRSSYDSYESFVESPATTPHDETVEPYMMTRARLAGGWPLDTKGAAFRQATAAAKSRPEGVPPADNSEVSMQDLREAAERAGISLPQLVGSLNSVHASVSGHATGQASEVADSDRPPMYDAGRNAQIEASTSGEPSRLY